LLLELSGDPIVLTGSESSKACILEVITTKDKLVLGNGATALVLLLDERKAVRISGPTVIKVGTDSQGFSKVDLPKLVVGKVTQRCLTEASAADKGTKKLFLSQSSFIAPVPKSVAKEPNEFGLAVYSQLGFRTKQKPLCAKIEASSWVKLSFPGEVGECCSYWFGFEKLAQAPTLQTWLLPQKEIDAILRSRDP